MPGGRLIMLPLRTRAHVDGHDDVVITVPEIALPPDEGIGTDGKNPFVLPTIPNGGVDYRFTSIVAATLDDIYSLFSDYLGRQPDLNNEAKPRVGRPLMSMAAEIYTSEEARRHRGEPPTITNPSPVGPYPPAPAGSVSANINPWRFPVTDVIGSPRTGPGILGPHSGVDIGCPCGTALPAMRSGKIVREGWAPAGDPTGIYVYMQYDDGMYAIFAHMADTVVSAGDRVIPSTIVGHSGNTPNTACHLHLELHSEYGHIGTLDKIVNPLDYFADLRT